MRIDFHYGPQPALQTDRNVSQGNPALGGSSQKTEPEQDQAEISAAHVKVQALAAQASQLPEVREARVQSLRQAISDGQYRADPEKVAGSLLSHMISCLSA